MATPLMSSSRDCPPRFATRRSRRQSLGGRVDQVAGLLGQPLMPWQRDVLDVALEVDPKTGLLAYRQVVLTVPRQSGKTWLLLCLMVHRALGFGEPQEIIYTAQNRLEARKKWEDDHVRRLERSPMRGRFKVRRQIGQEAIRWENGSLHAIASSTERSGHGSTLDLAVLDEAFAHEDARLEQALKPAMVTRPEPQMWIVSTAGTGKSAFLRGKVTAGRLKAAAGTRMDSAYFEWSAPDDADPGDPATWWGCMPALGITTDEAVIRAEFGDMELSDFRRAYLNQWPDISGMGLLDVHAWRACEDLTSCTDTPAAFGVEMSLDRTWTSIGVAGPRGDRVHVELVRRDRGIDWVLNYCRKLDRDHGHPVFVVDGGGPAGQGALIQDLKDAGLFLAVADTADVKQASAGMVDAVAQRTLSHGPQLELDEAVAGAKPRPLGDGGFAFGRKVSTVDITPLVAVTLALWGFTGQQPLSPDDVTVIY
jgi:Phage Terminase